MYRRFFAYAFDHAIMCSSRQKDGTERWCEILRVSSSLVVQTIFWFVHGTLLNGSLAKLLAGEYLVLVCMI